MMDQWDLFMYDFLSTQTHKSVERVFAFSLAAGTHYTKTGKFVKGFVNEKSQIIFTPLLPALMSPSWNTRLLD